MAVDTREVVARTTGANKQEDKRTVEQSKTAHQTKDVIPTIRSKEYHLNFTSDATLEGAVFRTYKSFKKRIDAVPPLPVSPHFADFVKDFESGDISLKNDDEITARAKEFIKRSDRQSLATGLAEWEIMTYQGGTLGQIKPVRTPEIQDFQPQVTHVGTRIEGQAGMPDIPWVEVTNSANVGEAMRKIPEAIRQRLEATWTPLPFRLQQRLAAPALASVAMLRAIQANPGVRAMIMLPPVQTVINNALVRAIRARGVPGWVPRLSELPLTVEETQILQRYDRAGYLRNLVQGQRRIEAREARKIKTHEYYVDFLARNDKGEVIIRFDLTNAAGNEILNDEQKDFLKDQFKLDHGDTLDVIQQEELRDRLDALTRARIDVYRKTDYPPHKLTQLNFVEPRLNPARQLEGADYADVVDAPHFFHEREAFALLMGGDNIATYNAKKLEQINVKVQAKTTAELAEIQRKADEEKAKGKRTGTMAEIDREVTALGVPEKTPEEIAQEKEDLDNEIKVNQSKQKKAERIEEMQKSIDENEEQRKVLSSQINKTARLSITNVKGNLETNRGTARLMERQLKTLNSQLSTLYTATTRDPKSGIERTAIDLSTQPAKDLKVVIDQLELDIEDNNQQAAILQTQIEFFESQLNPNRTKEENRQNLQTLEKTESDIKNFKARRAAYARQVKADLTVGAVPAVGGGLAVPGVRQNSEYFTKEIEKLGKRKEDIEKPSEWREQRKETLQAFKTVMSDYDAVQNRALEAQRGKLDLDVLPIYDNYPPVVLQIYQVMFGQKVLQADQTDLFRQAMAVLPPEKILELLNPAINARLGALVPPLPVLNPVNIEEEIYNPNLRNPDLIRAVDTTTINTLLTALETEARGGTLGIVDQAYINTIDDIRDAALVPIAGGVDPITVNILLEGIYYYKDEFDLARRIEIVMAAGGPGIVRGEARTYAQAVLAEKKKRLLI